MGNCCGGPTQGGGRDLGANCHPSNNLAVERDQHHHRGADRMNIETSWVDMGTLFTALFSTLTAAVAMVVAIRSDRRSREALKVQTYLQLRAGFLDIYRQLGKLDEERAEGIEVELTRQAYWHHAWDEYYVAKDSPLASSRASGTTSSAWPSNRASAMPHLRRPLTSSPARRTWDSGRTPRTWSRKSRRWSRNSRPPKPDQTGFSQPANCHRERVQCERLDRRWLARADCGRAGHATRQPASFRLPPSPRARRTAWPARRRPRGIRVLGASASRCRARRPTLRCEGKLARVAHRPLLPRSSRAGR